MSTYKLSKLQSAVEDSRGCRVPQKKDRGWLSDNSPDLELEARRDRALDRKRLMDVSSSPVRGDPQKDLFRTKTAQQARKAQEWWEAPVPEKWQKATVMPVDPEIEDLVNKIGGMVKPSLAKATPRYYQFMMFVRRNNLGHQTVGRSAVQFLLHLKKRGLNKKKKKVLMEATMHNYADLLYKHLSAKLGAAFTGREYLNNYRAMCEVSSMSERTEHAPDIDIKLIVKVLQHCKTKRLSFELVVVWLMSVTSGRLEDLVHIVGYILQQRDGEWTLAVDWGVRKNCRKKVLQSSATYKVPKELSKFVDQSKLKTYVPKITSGVGPLNKLLNEFKVNAPEPTAGEPRSARVAKESVSTYSFRRWAVQRFIRENTVNGITDWEAVIKLSGHMSKLMPQNIYARTAVEQAVALLGQEADLEAAENDEEEEEDQE
jgi:pterin-4a-carbinolamine dehydratase